MELIGLLKRTQLEDQWPLIAREPSGDAKRCAEADPSRPKTVSYRIVRLKLTAAPGNAEAADDARVAGYARKAAESGEEGA